MNDPSDLVKLLISDQLRVATGLWLLPRAYLGHEQDEAYRLGLEPVDLRLRLLQVLPQGTKYSGLSADRIINLIDSISEECCDWAGALVYNLDLLIARLNSGEQKIVWQDLFTALPHRHRCILLIMPETALNLLPSEEKLDLWRKENRLFGSVRNQ